LYVVCWFLNFRVFKPLILQGTAAVILVSAWFSQIGKRKTISPRTKPIYDN